jgi:hypothetical protein
MASPMQTVPMKNMIPLPQDTASTCWLACFRMLYAWLDYDAATIQPKLVAAGILWDDACATGLKTRDYMTAARALGLVSYGRGDSWSAGSFKRFLAVGPVWVAGRWMKDYSHNVVVIGASDDQIKYIDPWYDTFPEATIATRSADWFIKGDGGDAPGTDFYAGRIGAVQACAKIW